jgi:hypothetical protein
MKKVRYAEHIPGKVDHHYVVFLTRSGEKIVTGFFLTVGDAEKTASHIMRGKESSSTFLPLPGVFLVEREHYDKDLADMAKAGELVDCLIVENAPDSIDAIIAFSDDRFKGTLK